MTLNYIIGLIPTLETTIADNVEHHVQDADSTYWLAKVLMEFCHWFLGLFKLQDHPEVFLWTYVIVVILVSWGVGTLIYYIIVWLLHKLKNHLKSPIYGELEENNFFSKICRIIPPILFVILVQFTLYEHNSIATWLSRLAYMYVTLLIAVAACTVCDVMWMTFDQKENKRRLPLRGLLQVAKLFIWIIAIIIVAAILLDKSPGTLLAGLGAFAAVLMLVFKDSILGIVAGVQLAQNDSLHVGDWIAVPGTNANGTVSEVSLTDIKIINWDKTVSTVAPYTLISQGFQNYRNMQESNTRRIQRSYLIDADSIVETTPEMLESFKQIPLMKDWIEKKIAQRDAGKIQNVNNSEGLVDGTIDTNLGVFRAYMKLYLDSNPEISHVDDCFVTTLAQTQHGIPLQIYCFTATSGWFPFEGIQAMVFEQLAAMLHRFGLYTFENPSGRDTIIDGYLSPGKTSAPIFGIPYPFYRNSGSPMNPGIPPEGIYPNSITIETNRPNYSPKTPDTMTNNNNWSTPDDAPDMESSSDSTTDSESPATK